MGGAGDPLPTTPVALNVLELGWLLAQVWQRAKEGDDVARRLYLKVKEAAISLGVEWYYGDPWPTENT